MKLGLQLTKMLYKMSKSLIGKIALVTGGTKGIGKAIADKLHQEGARVVITARNNISDNPLGYHFIKVDHSQADCGEIIRKDIVTNFGRLDIIVNNAGANLTPGGGYSVLTDENWDNEIQLNLMSAVRTNKALIPLLAEQKNSAIVHISMNAALKPMWDVTMAYSAAKAALNVYSKALASELGSKGIRVNTVSPGLVKTPQMEQYIASTARKLNITTEEATKSLLDAVGHVPLGRSAEGEDIANLVKFLVSDDASYITGVIYRIDGGSFVVV